MGRDVCATVLSRHGLELAAAVDPAHVGSSVAELVGVGAGSGTGNGDGNGDGDLLVAADLDALADARVDVVVDFTHLDVSRATLSFCAESGIHAVIGLKGHGMIGDEQ